MGSTMAENHPVGFQWVMEAREKGATIIHVDPRYTRTSAMCQIWAPLRAGTDIAFLGGIVHYILENEKDFREYVLHYTNAPVILREDMKLPDENDGVFSGWNAEGAKYDIDTWLYEGEPRTKKGEVAAGHEESKGGHAKDRGGEQGKDKDFKLDMTLRDPRCVYQVLKRHYARYTPEVVEQITGCPKDAFLKICESFVNASGPEKTGAICYAVGWTHHSTGVQIIRTAAILQLLLGNIGRPGGGIMALRGHASIQGSTDIPTLFDILPGYLPMPHFESDGKDLKTYLEKHTTDSGLWHGFPS